MNAGEADKPLVLEACGVPYRWREGRVEFCLVSIERDSRWEFPHCQHEPQDDAKQAAANCAHLQAAINCRVASEESLGEFSVPIDGLRLQTQSFLLEVLAQTDTPAPRRTRWAFAEEAKARIRRKPMRRLVDLALRRLESN